MTDQGIFKRLKADHERHRELLDKIGDTSGDSEERRQLLEEFTKDVKSHAAAEEQSIYAEMLENPETTEDTRHSVAEHHELDEMLNDLAATDMSSSAWLQKFKKLDHDYRHHIDEEEQDHFPEFDEYLSKEKKMELGAHFEERKAAELETAEVTPEKMEDAKE